MVREGREMETRRARRSSASAGARGVSSCFETPVERLRQTPFVGVSWYIICVLIKK